jgi:hypothetical protein
MNKRRKYLVIATVIMILFTAYEKGDQTSGKEIATVKAKIVTFKQFSDDEYRWVEYEVTSIKYENNEFELNFSTIVPDEFLLPNSEKTIVEGVTISNSQAKTGLISVNAYNKAGNYIGGFALSSENYWSADYIYVDQSFTEKGLSNFGVEFDCSFEKGWNIRYYSPLGNGKYTTQKPLNEVFKWHYAEICID